MAITYRQLMDLGHEFAGLDSHGYKDNVKELERYLERRNISAEIASRIVCKLNGSARSA